MMRVVHLLDDFAMGGVTRALSLFEDERILDLAESRVVRMGRGISPAPHLDCDLIVIHVPPCWSRLPYLAALRLRNPHARIVQVEHSYTRAFEELKVSSRARFRALLQTAARPVDDVVAVSEAQRRWLAEAGVPVEKLQAIHPWSGRDELYEVRDLEPRERGPVELVAYGRYSAEKNFAALIEAMDEFGPGEAALTLFGSGPEEDALIALARERANVCMLPASDAFAARLENCDAVIVPSRFEAFGLVATEARMAGRPVLVADVDGLPEQVAQGGGLAAPMHDSAAIARSIRRLLQADLPAMGRAARASVRSQHDDIVAAWQAVIRKADPSNQNKTGRSPVRLAGV